MGELLGLVISKLLMLVGFIGVAGLLTFFLRMPDQLDAANQVQKLANQARTFMTTYYATNTGLPVSCPAFPAGGLVAAVGSGAVLELSPSCIGMPLEWQDANPYGQTHVIKIRQGAGAMIYGMVMTCGGDTISDSDLRKAAERAQPDGGAILISNPTVIRSSGRKWEVTASDYDTPSCPAVPGHLAAFVVLNGGEAIPPYLHTYKVGVSDEPNTMHTTLFMGGNTIENAQDVQLQLPDGSKKWLSSAIMDTSLVQDGTVIAKPSCPHGMLPSIIVTQGPVSDDGAGRPLVAVQPYAIDNNPGLPTGNWTVRLPVYTVNADGSGTRSVPPGPHALATVFIKCK